MKVIGIGETTLDSTFHLDSFVTEDQKTAATNVMRSVGGPIPAALILLQRLGLDCHLISQLGADAEGEYVRKKLAAENIAMNIGAREHTKHNLYLINGSSGSRTGVTAPRSNSPLQLSPDQLAQVATAQLLLIDRHEPLAAHKALSAINTNAVCLMDPSTDCSAQTMRLLWNTTVPIAPIELLKKQQPGKSLEAALQSWYEVAQKPIVLTIGSLGCLLYTGNIQHIPPVAITAVDTLGAGDIFRAGVGYGLLQQWSLIESLRFANIVAALQCCRPGNGTAIPQRSEVEQWRTTASFHNASISHISQYYHSLRV